MYIDVHQQIIPLKLNSIQSLNVNIQNTPLPYNHNSNPKNFEQKCKALRFHTYINVINVVTKFLRDLQNFFKEWRYDAFRKKVLKHVWSVFKCIDIMLYLHPYMPIDMHVYEAYMHRNIWWTCVQDILCVITNIIYKNDWTSQQSHPHVNVECLRVLGRRLLVTCKC